MRRRVLTWHPFRSWPPLSASPPRSWEDLAAFALLWVLRSSDGPPSCEGVEVRKDEMSGCLPICASVPHLHAAPSKRDASNYASHSQVRGARLVMLRDTDHAPVSRPTTKERAGGGHAQRWISRWWSRRRTRRASGCGAGSARGAWARTVATAPIALTSQSLAEPVRPRDLKPPSLGRLSPAWFGRICRREGRLACGFYHRYQKAGVPRPPLRPCQVLWRVDARPHAKEEGKTKPEPPDLVDDAGASLWRL